MSLVAAVRVGDSWVVLTPHAMTRWHQRERPAIALELVLEQLATEVARHGQVTRRRPRGIELYGMRQKLVTVAWLTLEPVVFPLVQSGHSHALVATTCITRRNGR